MSNTPKSVTPAEIKAMADEKQQKKSVPNQYHAATDAKIEAALVDVQESAVDALQDSLRDVEARLKHVYGVGVKVRINHDDEGEFTVEIVDPNESKLQKLKDGAKGLFQRNKKLILASAALVATSFVLKAVAASQRVDDEEEYAESEVIEPSES